ncbi:hypothetical protein EDB19DRAFT_1660440 [Suillus lakei]|nr:hypothetical protein EDB19DRAFT_1660440 [Suillus lakei]
MWRWIYSIVLQTLVFIGTRTASRVVHKHNPRLMLSDSMWRTVEHGWPDYKETRHHLSHAAVTRKAMCAVAGPTYHQSKTSDQRPNFQLTSFSPAQSVTSASTNVA